MKSHELTPLPQAPATTTFEVVDVESLDAGDPARAVKRFEMKGKPPVRKVDLLIAGGSMGGVAAAMTACRLGLTVCMFEETSWLGGQMTSQGVSALDENALVETTGATRSYKDLREAVRNHYRRLGAVDGKAQFSPFVDPGNSWVSRLAFEPKVALAKVAALLEPFIRTGQLVVMVRHKVVRVRKRGAHIRTMQAVGLDDGRFVEVACRYCLDATELGDILALADVPYSSGAESRSETGEEHAPEQANPENVQDFTYPFVVELCQGEKHPIAKPPLYEQFKQQGKFTLAGYKMFENSQKKVDGRTVELLPFWTYRRLIDKSNFPKAAFANDIAMINWESNDLRGQNIVDKPPVQMARRLANGKNLALGFLYWLQHEAPRDDGGTGYPELKLRPDILGSADGLSLYPYIRECRRIKARKILVEKDVVAATNSGVRARFFFDSIAIGHYPVDIHGAQDVPGAAQSTVPFQIPCGALVQSAVRNLIPCCKNIGTTHVTNGAVRLHPIEWGIGEAAATLAYMCIKHGTDPLRLIENRMLLRTVQRLLVEGGAPIFWFDDLPPEHVAFAATQFLCQTGVIKVSENDLHFRPDDLLTYDEAAAIFCKLLRLPVAEGVKGTLLSCAAAGLFEDAGASGKVKRSDLDAWSRHPEILFKGVLPEGQSVTRADFSVWLYPIVRSDRFFGRF